MGMQPPSTLTSGHRTSDMLESVEQQYNTLANHQGTGMASDATAGDQATDQHARHCHGKHHSKHHKKKKTHKHDRSSRSRSRSRHRKEKHKKHKHKHSNSRSPSPKLADSRPDNRKDVSSSYGKQLDPDNEVTKNIRNDHASSKQAGNSKGSMPGSTIQISKQMKGGEVTEITSSQGRDLKQHTTKAAQKHGADVYRPHRRRSSMSSSSSSSDESSDDDLHRRSRGRSKRREGAGNGRQHDEGDIISSKHSREKAHHRRSGSRSRSRSRGRSRLPAKENNTKTKSRSRSPKARHPHDTNARLEQHHKHRSIQEEQQVRPSSRNDTSKQHYNGHSTESESGPDKATTAASSHANPDNAARSPKRQRTEQPLPPPQEQRASKVQGPKPAVKLSFSDDLETGDQPLPARSVNDGIKHHHHQFTPITTTSTQQPAIVRMTMLEAQQQQQLQQSNGKPMDGSIRGSTTTSTAHASGKLLAKMPAQLSSTLIRGRTGNILISDHDDLGLGASSSGLSDSEDMNDSGDAAGPARSQKAKPGRLGRVVFGVAQTRGARPYMEDRHVFMSCWRPQAPGGRPVEDGVERAYAAVFDGHNGARTADVAAAQLHHMLAADPVFRNHTGCLGSQAAMAVEEAAVAGALKHAFKTLDESVLDQAVADGGRDGATALVLMRLSDTLYVAHAGDSRAVLCKAGGYAYPLTRDHKPDLPSEKARVEAAGGRIELQKCWRVMVDATPTRPGSGLAVSRSLGDIDFKRPTRLVESLPDVTRYVPRPGDAFVILASDGLWDVLSDQDAVEVVNNSLQSSKASVPTTAAVTAAAEAAMNLAVRRGTWDNVTCVVMALTWGT